MEVTALDGRWTRIFARIPQFVYDNVHHTVSCLDLSADTEKRQRTRLYGELRIDARPQDRVHEAGFVLHGHEHDARGGPRTLPAIYDTGVIDAPAIVHA